MVIVDKQDVAPAKPDPGSLIAALAERLPAAFVAERWRAHRPLKIRIDADLVAVGIMKPWEVGLALRCYTKRYQYRLAVAAGGARFDLDGNPAGEVTPEEATHAREMLAAQHAEATAAAAAHAALKAERQATKSEREASKAAEGRAWIKARQAARKAAEGVNDAAVSDKAEPVKTQPLPTAVPRRLSLEDLRQAARARAANQAKTKPAPQPSVRIGHGSGVSKAS